MTEPEKRFVIGINTEVERPAGWTAGQGGNLTFTVSTLAADLAAALARAEAAEARVKHLEAENAVGITQAIASVVTRDLTADDTARIAALEAAARAVVDVWTVPTRYPRTHLGVVIGALATLLGEEA
jgi:hypothetical protein